MGRMKLMAYRRAGKGRYTVRQLRREGKLPAVLYGRDTEETISVDAQSLRSILESKSVEHNLIDLFMNSDPPKRYPVKLRAVQTDIVSLVPLYADFDRVAAE